MLGPATRHTDDHIMAQSQLNMIGPHVDRKAGENNPLGDAKNDAVFTDDEQAMNNGREQMITELKRCDSCGRMFKGDKGVKIHFGKVHKSKPNQEEQTQRSQATPRRKTRRNPDQEAHHRVQETRESVNPEADNANARVSNNIYDRDGTSRKKLRWPSAIDKQWAQFDDDLDILLNNTLKGNAVVKIEKMTKMTYSMGEARFGTKENASNEKGKAGPKPKPTAN